MSNTLARLFGRQPIAAQLTQLALLLLLIFVAFQAFLLDRLQGDIEAAFHQQINGITHAGATVLSIPGRSNDADTLAHLTRPLATAPGIVFFLVTDSLENPAYQFRTRAHQALIDQFSGGNLSVFRSDGLQLVRKDIFVEERYAGFLLCAFSEEWVVERWWSALRWAALYATLFALLLFIAVYLLSKSVSTPLLQASELMSESDGISPDPVELSQEYSAEARAFARVFAMMAGRYVSKSGRRQSQETQFAAFFQQNPAAMIVTDTIGKVVHANEMACMLFNMDMAHLQRADLESLLGTKGFYPLKEQLGKSEENLRRYSVMLPEAGVARAIEFDLNIIRNPLNTPQYYVIVIDDVTEKLKNHLEQASQTIPALIEGAPEGSKLSELEQANIKNKTYARRLGRFIKAGYEIVQSSSVSEVIDVLVANARELLNADQSIIFARDLETDQLLPIAYLPNDDPSHIPRPLSRADLLVWHTFLDNKPLRIDASMIKMDDRSALNIGKNDSPSILTVPLCHLSLQFGVLIVISDKPDQFSEDDLHLLTILAHQAAIQIRYMSLIEESEQLSGSSESLSRTLEETRRQVSHLHRIATLGMLTGGIAHDFNNVMGMITPNLELLENALDDRPELREKVSTLREIVNDARGLTRQILNFSRKEKASRVVIDPGPFILEFSTLMQRTIGKQIQVTVDLPDRLPAIKADPSQLKQILLNLAVNARDAMPDGGKLALTVSVADALPPTLQGTGHDYIKLSVADSGHGIPLRFLKRVFDPFFTSKGEESGTGLGLSIVQSIVKSHGGQVEVQSSSDGTTFDLFLPATSEKPQRHAPPGVGKSSGVSGGEQILVVDDEKLIRESLQDSLASLGYHAILAESGQAALDIIRSGEVQIDAAIIDMAMPEMDGMQTIQEIHKLDDSLKILVSSGYSTQEVMPRADQRLIGFLPKPHHLDDLAAMLDSALHRQKSGD